ncbi:hypothetical protein DRQ29_05175, partial [bacterium]
MGTHPKFSRTHYNSAVQQGIADLSVRKVAHEKQAKPVKILPLFIEWKHIQNFHTPITISRRNGELPIYR